MERGPSVFIPAGTGVPVMTVPVGHKYEIIGGYWGSDAVAGHGAYLLLSPAAGGTNWVYSRSNTPAEYAFDFQWTGFVVEPGDTITAFALGAGYAGLTLVLMFIDVDYGE